MDRATARAHGMTRYLGKPCPHCAGRVRYVSSASCVACLLKPIGKAAERAKKARYRAGLALARHEYARLLRMRDSTPDLMPVLDLDEPRLPARRRYRPRSARAKAPIAELYLAALAH